MNGHSKISIIGAGSVGATAAFSIAQKHIARELVIIDVNNDKAEGEAMDINHGLITIGRMNIHSGSYADIKDSDIIVVAAGLGRKPGETRLDLASKNIVIAKDIAANIMQHYNGGVILVVSNPVDIMTYVILKETGLPAGKVFGSGTVLDSARFRYMLAKQLNAEGIHSPSEYKRILGERYHNGRKIDQTTYWTYATVHRILQKPTSRSPRSSPNFATRS